MNRINNKNNAKGTCLNQQRAKDVFVNDIGGQFRISKGATVASDRNLDNQIRGPVASVKGDHLACANEKGGLPRIWGILLD